MPLHAYVLLSLLAAPASVAPAQELGARVRPAEAMIPGLAPGQDDLDEAIAAAERHPLGTLQNPIRVGGPTGERAYLARLRCPDRSVPRIGARADAGTGAFGSVTGGYALTCGSSELRIVFDMYHEEHAEDRAPDGLMILPR